MLVAVVNPAAARPDISVAPRVIAKQRNLAVPVPAAVDSAVHDIAIADISRGIKIISETRIDPPQRIISTVIVEEPVGSTIISMAAPRPIAVAVILAAIGAQMPVMTRPVSPPVCAPVIAPPLAIGVPV